MTIIALNAPVVNGEVDMVRSAGGVNSTDPSGKMRLLRQKVRADRPSIHAVSAHGGFFGAWPATDFSR